MFFEDSLTLSALVACLAGRGARARTRWQRVPGAVAGKAMSNALLKLQVSLLHHSHHILLSLVSPSAEEHASFKSQHPTKTRSISPLAARHDAASSHSSTPQPKPYHTDMGTSPAVMELTAKLPSVARADSPAIARADSPGRHSSHSSRKLECKVQDNLNASACLTTGGRSSSDTPTCGLTTSCVVEQLLHHVRLSTLAAAAVSSRMSQDPQAAPGSCSTHHLRHGLNQPKDRALESLPAESASVVAGQTAAPTGVRKKRPWPRPVQQATSPRLTQSLSVLFDGAEAASMS